MPDRPYCRRYDESIPGFRFHGKLLQSVSHVRIVACPRCGARVEWTPAARWRPFCSERCKVIDLGAWASEAYRIPTAAAPDSDDPVPGPDDHPRYRGSEP
jgi:uncharacterized protein